MANDRFQKLRVSEVFAKLTGMHDAHLRTGRVQHWKSWSCKVRFGPEGYAYQTNWSANWINAKLPQIARLLDDLQNCAVIPEVHHTCSDYVPLQEIGEA